MVDAGVRSTPAPRTRNDDLELLFEFDQSILPGLRCTPGGAGGDVLSPRLFRDQHGEPLLETRQGASEVEGGLK